jgi:hypothetical protein
MDPKPVLLCLAISSYFFLTLKQECVTLWLSRPHISLIQLKVKRDIYPQNSLCINLVETDLKIIQYFVTARYNTTRMSPLRSDELALLDEIAAANIGAASMLQQFYKPRLVWFARMMGVPAQDCADLVQDVC